jgi:hypothetical protein
MSRDATQVAVGQDLYAYVAPTGSTAPTDATTAVAAAFKDLGWVNEDGLTEGASLEKTDIKGVNGSTVRSVITGQSKTFKLTLLESKNINVLGLYYGSSSTFTGATGPATVSVKSKARDLRAFIFDIFDGSDTTRIYVPTAEVSSVGDIVYNASGTPIGYEVEITAYADTSNVWFKKFTSYAIV